MLLAQLDPDPVALKSWLGVLFYIIGCITAVVLLVNQFRGGKQEITNNPLEVKQHPGSVSREELKQVHGRIERERKEIDREIARIEMAAEKRMESLDKNLRTNTDLTSKMSGVVEQMNQSVHTLSTSLTNFMRDQAKK